MIDKRTESKVDMVLKELRGRGRVAVALSGGVDSSTLTALAFKALGENAIAVTIKSPLTIPEEAAMARKVAKLIGVKHIVIPFNELEIPGFDENPPERCYLCKKRRSQLLKKEVGGYVIADGTTADDLKDYRPGIRALKEEGVWSPLLEAKLTKKEVRMIAEELGLPNSDAPPNSCLATRFPHGEKLTPQKLSKVAEAERVVRETLSVRLVRVRVHGQLARIEVGEDELEKALNKQKLREAAVKIRKLGYRFATLDLEGYKPGKHV